MGFQNSSLHAQHIKGSSKLSCWPQTSTAWEKKANLATAAGLYVLQNITDYLTATHVTGHTKTTTSTVPAHIPGLTGYY